MTASLAAILLALGAPVFGAQATAVRRGDLLVHVKATGTSSAEGVFRLKSTIDGRLENVSAATSTWRAAGDTLALLADKDLAAMIDAKGSQDQDVVEDRWKRVYRPTPVRCPDDCYILKVFARARNWVKPQAVLFEAARALRMTGRVTGPDAALVREGMPIAYWPAGEPQRRMAGRVTQLARERDGGASFTLEVPRERLMPPGARWEGEIVPLRKDDVLLVPTAALIRHEGRVYLPVLVSTGVTSDDLTQITAGADERRGILVLDDSQLHGAARHSARAEAPARELISRDEEIPAAPAPRAAPPPKPAPAPRPAATNSHDDGDDPYGDQ